MHEARPLLALGDAPQDRVHEPRRLRRERPDRGHRLPDRRVRGHAIHQEELRGAEAQRRENRRVEGGRRLLEVPLEHVVEADRAAQRLLDERAEEVAVARVELAAARVEKRGGMRSLVDAQEDSERELARGARRGHPPQVSPAATRSPRTKSAAGSARRPSACSVATATAPSPQATTTRLPASRTSPGLALSRAGPLRAREARQLHARISSSGKEPGPRGEGSRFAGPAPPRGASSRRARPRA